MNDGTAPGGVAPGVVALQHLGQVQVVVFELWA